MRTRMVSTLGDRHTWGLVLAAGEGRRLAALTTTSRGTAIPKQYCSLWDGRSLLQESLHRTQRVVTRERVCTIVAANHRLWWEPLTWSLPARNTIVQPENRGTAVGVLLPLLHILQRDPEAQILIMPSDHHVRDEPVLAQAMRRALSCARRNAGSVVLLGFKPDDPDCELGYIAPGERPDDDGAYPVAEFVEKPTAAQARELIGRHALWNGFIVAASAQALLRIYEQRYPELVGVLAKVAERDAACPVDAVAALEIYDQLPQLDFSRDILQGMEAQLRVLQVPDCGWTDLGCPAAVVRVARNGTVRSGPGRDPWGFPVLSLSQQSLMSRTA